MVCFSCIFCSTQTKINKSEEIDILIKTPVNLKPEEPLLYTIKNNSDKTFIIDPYGFVGESYWTLNSKKLNPINFSRGYYPRDEDDCKNELIIIKPKQKIDANLSLNYLERGIYDYSKTGDYLRVINSSHNKENGKPSSCRQYINELELKGYHFLNDNIVAKIPFVK